MTFRTLAALTAVGTVLASGASAARVDHLIIVMQENRSFDHYFGTFPGADGIPAGTCVPLDPRNPAQGCVAPWHDTVLENAGGGHSAAYALADIDDGRMDGFLYQQTLHATRCSARFKPAACAGIEAHDAVGYHTSDEIPNYWKYARHFELLDHLFGSAAGPSLPNREHIVGAWSAACTSQSPLSCTTNYSETFPPFLSWTPLTWLLDRAGVGWRYYLGEGDEPDCDDGAMDCDPRVQTAKVPGTWNPLPKFTTYNGGVFRADQFLLDAQGCSLPTVSWIAPGNTVSEHPSNSVVDGMNWVTSVVNAVMSCPELWATSAIIITYDEWGGFYDHESPPLIDANNSWGIRVPGLIVSPWTKSGVFSEMVSNDQIVKLIEDWYLGGQRLNPSTDGRPDSRPIVYEDPGKVYDRSSGRAIVVGDLRDAFQFTVPLPTLTLPLR